MRYGLAEVDTYLVHRTADLDEQHVRDMAGEIGTIAPDTLADVIEYVENKVAECVSNFVHLAETT